MSTTALPKQFGTILFKALLALFLLPGFTLWFAIHLRADADTRIQAELVKAVQDDSRMPAQEKQEAEAFFSSVLASTTCFSSDPRIASYRDGVCERFSSLWQFAATERTALVTVVCNTMLLFILAGLGALAFANRGAQYRSFVVGWRLLIGAAAAQVIVQGAFLVWLSFWLTAWFMEVYSIKLIAAIGLLVAVAVLTAVVAIFRKVSRDNRVHGEIVPPEQAAALWARVREFARRLDTSPPQQIIAGIDANFFVTETPLTVGARQTQGRTLFVSLPLLRQLEQDEADAILAHELGHFAGGDTANSAALGPKLSQYDDYTRQMYSGGPTLLAFYLLCLYRVIFETALMRSSRQREFAADRVAAQLTSPAAMARALVKVAAYSRYRDRVEHALFQQNDQHDNDLGIGHRVASGLAAFSRSAEFSQAMQSANVPHPFDSHPPMAQRLAEVGHIVADEQFADVVCATPANPWTHHIVVADAIEQRLWRQFEQQFTQAHDESLAYRYVPSNETEQELVLRYFPPVQFATKKGAVIEINYRGLVLPDQQEMLDWDRVKTVQYNDALAGADRLVIEHPERGWLGAKSSKLSIPIAKSDRERFKAVLGRYWHRHRVMRASAQESSGA